MCKSHKLVIPILRPVHGVLPTLESTLYGTNISDILTHSHPIAYDTLGSAGGLLGRTYSSSSLHAILMLSRRSFLRLPRTLSRPVFVVAR
ncbi:hypothetical protein BDR05DRAFT_961805 [Suillus weaverae]|nr:hypothetical protein BDR05DRAFT_961805 [Suillus weaverae]